MTQERQRQVIGNVGLLDIRHAEPASIEAIERIGNVGTVLYSRATAGLLTKLNIGNIGSSLEVPDDTQLVSGQITIHRDFFQEQTTPLNLMLAGQMIVKPDVSAEELTAGIGSLYVAGQIVCPQHLIGSLQPKIKNLSGQTVVYTGDARLVMGKLKLDAAYLHGLNDQSSLLVLGKVDALDVLDNDLLKTKVRELHVLGKIRYHQENGEAFRTLLTGDAVRSVEIPAGYAVIDRSVVLDSMLLSTLKSRRLYSTGRIEIGADVPPELLDERIDGLKSEEMIVCAKSLSQVMADKVDLLADRVIFYAGEIWIVDGEEILRSARFDYLDGSMTLLVTGELTIDPSIEPAVLAQRLHQVMNFGSIQCTPAQMGAVQARLTLDEGELVDSMAAEDDILSLGNVGHLAL